MTTPAEPLPAGIDLSRRPNPTLVKEVGPAGGPGTIPYLVDLWLDHQRLPPWITHAEPAPGFREL